MSIAGLELQKVVVKYYNFNLVPGHLNFDMILELASDINKI